MQQTPIDPSKIHGKFTPPAQNTDITADPIDNPPEKSPQKSPNLPKPAAMFEERQKDTRPVNGVAIYLSVAFLAMAILIPFAISKITVTAAGAGLSYVIQIACALASLVFNMQNPNLQEKKYPVLGFNPLHTITIICCILILFGAWSLLSFIISGGRG